MIENLKDNENTILENLKEAYKNNNETFNYDGLVFRGEAKRNADGNWYYESGDEVDLWNNNDGKRIMVLTKDLPNDSEQDIRRWTGRDNEFEEQVIDQNLFFQNLVRWVVGIYSILNGNEIKYNELSEKEWLERFDNVPLVRINVKKNKGNSYCPTNVLAEYIDRYKEYLLEQITMYEADVIVCCGFEDRRVSCIKQLFGDKFEYVKLNIGKQSEDGKWILKGRMNDKEVVIINMWHPSSPGQPHSIKRVAAYKDLMLYLSKAIKK